MSNAADISHLISTAGSPEAVIHHLLKEKQHSAAQNAQLWRLVDKQRALVLGLNNDLERALKDKERYRKKFKEQVAQAPPVPGLAPADPVVRPREASDSSARSESLDDLPIQRHSVLRTGPTSLLDSDNAFGGSIVSTPDRAMEIDPPKRITASPILEEKQTVAHDQDVVDDTVAAREAAPGTGDILSSSRRVDPLLTPIQTTGLGKPTHHSHSESPFRITPDGEAVASPGSFTARRSNITPRKPNSSPLIGSFAQGDDHETSSPMARKAPPAPLKLQRPTQTSKHLHQYGPDDHSGSEYDDVLEVDEIPAFERGRKKTREEDDKEREAAALKEQEHRSRSKKDKGSKPTSAKAGEVSSEDAFGSKELSKSPSLKALSPNSTLAAGTNLLSPHASIAGLLSPPTSNSNPASERGLLSPSPLSPGLPLSPRPGDRPLNSPTPRLPRDGAAVASPPMSPRSAFAGLPLSPRAPRHPIPLPPHTPTSLASPPPSRTESQQQAVPPVPVNLPDESISASGPALDQETVSIPQEVSVVDLKAGGIYRGLVSESYPDLLLPPNALPSILVKVNSSRLKPSRMSTMIPRSSEEESVFTLGVSARSDRGELWRVEKPLMSLPNLDNQLKQASTFSGKLPDRALFNGHAPAKIDARRMALEKYFEGILDTPMDEKAALIVCRFLSTQVVPSDGDDVTSINISIHPGSPTTSGPDGRMVKEGYLTKRGKNFGGWKARFFVLDEPILRYYESPGGALLGTIKLHNAQIGKQSTHHSPSRAHEDPDSQYRHAFLILEPKRKDSSSHMKHVLCAENDAERDQWVHALLQYVGSHSDDEKPKPLVVRNGSSSNKLSILQAKKKNGRKDDMPADSPESEKTDALQSLNYEETGPAQQPVRMTTDRRDIETPSPPANGDLNHGQGTPSQSSKPISGPTNGAVIQDAGAWGNKPMESPKAKDKKRSLWGFRDKPLSDIGTFHSNESTINVVRPQHPDRPANTKAVFGIPLAEAVELSPPHGTDICLPAVVYRCLEYLEAKHAASEEGIFRLSGSNVVIKALRERFNTEGDFDFLTDGQYYDVHAVASLLKLYLRELPSTVLTRELHLDFLAVLGMYTLQNSDTTRISTNSFCLELDEKAKKVAAYNVLVHKLPLPNWTLIRALSAFLIGVVTNSDVNKMSVRNVGIVFSPTLNIPAPVFSMFLTDFDAIFGTEPDDSIPTPIEVSVTEPLTPEDVRSPRRQLFSDIPTPSYNQDTFPKQGLTYEQVLRDSHKDMDTGFIPLQPSYETTAVGSRESIMGHAGLVTVPGPEYGGAFQRTLEPLSTRDTKARRRESSMLLMGMHHGQRKSSLPMLGERSS